jgi:hypothetical protein
LEIVSGESGAVAAVTALVDFDTSGLTYAGDHGVAGAMQAAVARHGRLTLAAAHPTGFPSPRIGTLRFVVRDSAALARLALQLPEVRRLDGTDARNSLPHYQLGVRREEAR